MKRRCSRPCAGNRVVVRGVLLLGATITGCLEAPSEARAPPLELLSVDPSQNVPLDQVVHLTFSKAVGPVDADAVSVRQKGGGEVPRRILRLGDPRILGLAPNPAWPSDAFLEVLVSERLVDDRGRPVVSNDGFAFRTRASGPRPAPIVVRGPLVGVRAPANLAWILLASSDLPTEFELQLESEGGPTISLDVGARSDSAVLARLAAYRGPCAPLCPGTRYRVRVEGGGTSVVARGDVETSTATDRTAPALIGARMEVQGDRLYVDVDSPEPILVLGDIVAETGERFPLALPDRFAPQIRVRTREVLPSGVGLRAELRVVDTALNALETTVGPVRLRPRPQITLQEVVASPLRDWSDSEGGSIPFDGVPGYGSVNDNDEWVELVNQGPEPIDLLDAALELRALDGSPTVTPLAGAPQFFFGNGGTLRRWWPGEALVVRVRGALSQRDLTVELWWGSVLLDQVVFAEAAFADHPGGPPPDAVHESIARDVEQRWRWCVPSPGDPLLSTACR